jgi:hypothetical protein
MIGSTASGITTMSGRTRHWSKWPSAARAGSGEGVDRRGAGGPASGSGRAGARWLHGSLRRARSWGDRSATAGPEPCSAMRVVPRRSGTGGRSGTIGEYCQVSARCVRYQPGLTVGRDQPSRELPGINPAGQLSNDLIPPPSPRSVSSDPAAYWATAVSCTQLPRAPETQLTDGSVGTIRGLARRLRPNCGAKAAATGGVEAMGERSVSVLR